MEIVFFKKYDNGNTKQCIGNKHIIKLLNREKIIVATDKETDIAYGEWWNVTDIKNGINLCGWKEHTNWLLRDAFNCNTSNEKEVLKFVKKRLDLITNSGKTYKQLI